MVKVKPNMDIWQSRVTVKAATSAVSKLIPNHRGGVSKNTGLPLNIDYGQPTGLDRRTVSKQ